MKIRNQLLLLFLVLFGVLLLAFSIFIYLSSAQTRKDEYYKQLKREAITKANLLFDAKVAPSVLQLIYKNSANSLFEEEVAVYDTSFNLLYHDAVQIDKVKETRKMIDQIVQQKEITFDQGSLQVVGLLYIHHGKNYVLTAAANDEYGIKRLGELKNTLILSFIIIICFTVIAGYYFAGRALKPVAEIIDNVKEITATRLDMRVPVKSEKDEIGELAITFNQMLDRLENSFNAQKSFVNNISHELRTPLATVVGELQLALIKDRSITEYKEVIRLSLHDAKRLVKLSNGLLDLAKANFDQREIRMKELRVDELLMDARETVIKTLDGFNVDVLFEQEIENDDNISVMGNEYLLKVAFINLMENACKFSPDHLCTVTITYLHEKVILAFKDNGIGISEQDIPHIFSEFFRGTNKDFTWGNGIGLSLTDKIISMHGGSITVASTENKGSTFSITLLHV
ncbi:HAMP domain-containing sensor histidine kinase [Mucilaginibacter lappiensis]|uniref:histidine kinase n=1 Tax=Mucilaginibacter lappiensis TaxID=354630 RepID=A0A841JL19_9SPHI|nr:HAMP domain-containing sensor histidine kinase [Mucilaginibacter lappiensis]MBB6128641.1 signal transduction histidine kinase [Mucilaginibacter lappiensis]